MTQISRYIIDTKVTGSDKWIGSDSETQNTTKNFTPNKLSVYFNENQVIDIGTPIRYRYDILELLDDRLPGTITFFPQVGTPYDFSDITNFILSKYTLKGNDVSEYLDFLVGKKILISNASNTNIFGYYRLDSLIENLLEPNFFDVTLTYLTGNGAIVEDKDYLISLVDAFSGDIPTKTSDLINDGEDGVHPFITLQDVSGFVPYTGATNDINIGTHKITADNGTTNSEMSPSLFGVENNSGNTYGLLEYNQLTMLSPSGSIGITASGITFPNASLQTTAFPPTGGTSLQYIKGDGTLATFPSTSIPTLDQVLTAGNTSLLDAEVNTIGVYDATELAYGYLSINNSDFTLSDSLGIGSIISRMGITFSGQIGGSSGTILLSALTASRTYTLPNASGTVALTSDIPSLAGYVPTSRTLTINGVGYDLTADRTWTVSGGLPTGGTAGQILTKVDATNYNATWQENYADWTSVVKHTVKNNGLNGTITKGTAVYVTGSNGTNMLVGRASNVSESTSSKTMGLMESDITTTGGTQTGFVITEGLLSGLNTAGQTAGDPIWLGVNGALIYGLINKPYAPAHLVFIGIVTKVSAGNGEIFVKVQNGFELKEIHDVDIITTTPINGHLLGFDGTLWVNKTIAGWLGFTPVTDTRSISTTTPLQGGGDLSANRTFSILQSNTTQSGFLSNTDWNTFNGKFNLPSLTSGSVLFSNGTTIAQDNANFFWDDTNNRLGIGTATPGAKLGVAVDGTDSKIQGIQLTIPESTIGSARIGLVTEGVSRQQTYIKFMKLNAGVARSGTIAFFTAGIDGDNGTEQMRITETGNVGINITAPTAKLTIKAPGALSTDIALRVRDSTDTFNLINVNGLGQTSIGPGTATLTNILTVQNIYSTSVGIEFRSDQNPRVGSTFNTSKILSGYSSSTESFLDLQYAGGAYPYTYTTGLRLNSLGNVGINTTAPTAKLHIKAGGALSTDIALRVRNSADTSDLMTVNGAGTAIIKGASTDFYVNSNSALNSTGRFVILNHTGSSSPLGYVIQRLGSELVKLTSDDGTGNLILQNSWSNYGMEFNTAGANTRMFISGVLGNIGIGTTAPVASAKVQIDSTTQGFLPSRMTNAQRIAIATPAVGLCVYCTDVVEGLYINKSTGWTYIG